MAARRLAFLAELIKRRIEPDSETGKLSCDDWDSMTAEAGCAMGISPRRASTQLRYAEALDERLPKVAALLAAGVLSVRVASTIIWRTHLVVDRTAMALIDAGIAARAAGCGVLSDVQLDLTIDAVLEEHDPQARRHYRDAARQRDIQVGKPDDETGTASVWGRLSGPVAELLDRTLEAISRTVCPDDPRSVGERRSDAVGAILAHTDRLACRCTKPDCRAATIASRADSVVIHILADDAAVQAALQDAQHEQQQRGQDSDGEPAAAADEANAASGPKEAEPNTKGKKPFRAAIIVGGGIVPAPLLAELINSGARVEPLPHPCQTAEPRHRPSRKLRRFIQCRDLTCRFPYCNRPAVCADLDHTVPYPTGSTHASNLKALCRKHHLLRTFWTGPDGWSDIQHPDGTVIWTSPTGHTYTTKPGSQLLFPNWNTTTPPPTDPGPRPQPNNTTYRRIMMPKRRRTRAQDRAARIEAERKLNDTS